MKKAAYPMIVLLFLLLFVSACVPNVKLPYDGLFYISNGKVQGIPQSDVFPFAVSENDPIINNHKPTLYFNYYSTNIDGIKLHDLTRQGYVSFKVKELKDGVTEFLPETNIEDGDYCLVIGDRYSTLEDLVRWCFKIGDPKAIKATASALSNILEQKMNVNPPAEGLYFVDDDLNTTEIDLIRLPTRFQNLSDYTKLPATSNPRAVVILKSSDVNIDNFHLYRGRPQAGISLDSESSPCTSTGGNLRTGTKILAVNGTSISTCDEMIELVRMMKPMDNVSLTLQIGTSNDTYSFLLDRATFSDPKPIPISVKWGDGYIAIVPEQVLSAGLYCYAEKGWASGYCFRME